MSINSFLCKHFDDNRKGYVNIGDIITKPFIIIGDVLGFVFSEEVFPLLVFVGLGLFVIGMFSAILQGFITSDTDMTGILIASFKGLIAPAIMVLIAYLMYEPAKYILNLKIAKCPLKENKEDD